MAAVVEPVLLFGEVLAAAAGADDHADLAQFVAGHALPIDPRVFQGFGHARRRQWNRARDMRPVFDLHVFLLVEFVRHFARDLHDEARRIEAGDSSHTAQAVPGGLPKAFTPDSVRADRTDSCDHNTTHEFALPLVFSPV